MSMPDKLPDDDRNGMPAIANAGLNRPRRLIAAIVVMDVQKITTNMDTGGKSATMRVRRIEKIHDEDLHIALMMYHKAFNERLSKGGELFNAVLEPEIQVAFTGAYKVDSVTGEVVYYDDERFLNLDEPVKYATADPVNADDADSWDF